MVAEAVVAEEASERRSRSRGFHREIDEIFSKLSFYQLHFVIGGVWQPVRDWCASAKSLPADVTRPPVHNTIVAYALVRTFINTTQ